jgi:hypothetical protein
MEIGFHRTAPRKRHEIPWNLGQICHGSSRVPIPGNDARAGPALQVGYGSRPEPGLKQALGPFLAAYTWCRGTLEGKRDDNLRRPLINEKSEDGRARLQVDPMDMEESSKPPMMEVRDDG